MKRIEPRPLTRLELKAVTSEPVPLLWLRVALVMFVFILIIVLIGEWMV